MIDVKNGELSRLIEEQQEDQRDWDHAGEDSRQEAGHDENVPVISVTPGRAIAHPLSLDTPIAKNDAGKGNCDPRLALLKRLKESAEELTDHKLPCHGCGSIISSGSGSIEIYLDPAATKQIVPRCDDCAESHKPPGQSPPDWLHDLTQEQRRLHDLALQGLTQRQIAEQMGDGWYHRKVGRCLAEIKRIKEQAKERRRAECPKMSQGVRIVGKEINSVNWKITVTESNSQPVDPMVNEDGDLSFLDPRTHLTVTLSGQKYEDVQEAMRRYNALCVSLPRSLEHVRVELPLEGTEEVWRGTLGTLLKRVLAMENHLLGLGPDPSIPRPLNATKLEISQNAKQ